MAKDAEEVPAPRLFEPNGWARVLPATTSGLLPRLATGCGEATVVDFDFATRTYSVKPLAMYALGQTMIPGSAVVSKCRRNIAAAAQQRGGEGDQRALAKERAVAHRAVREAAMAYEARGEEGRGRERQNTRLWILVFHPVSLSFTGLQPTGL